MTKYYCTQCEREFQENQVKVKSDDEQDADSMKATCPKNAAHEIIDDG